MFRLSYRACKLSATWWISPQFICKNIRRMRFIPLSKIYTILRFLQDIVNAIKSAKVDQLERIVKFAFDNVGRTFSAAFVSKYLKAKIVLLIMKQCIIISANWKVPIFSIVVPALMCRGKKS